MESFCDEEGLRYVVDDVELPLVNAEVISAIDRHHAANILVCCHSGVRRNSKKHDPNVEFLSTTTAVDFLMFLAATNFCNVLRRLSFNMKHLSSKKSHGSKKYFKKKIMI